MPGRRIPCVGAIITGADGRLLLIKRGREPEAGRWSVPGGRIEHGETDQQALVREVREETGLHVNPGRLVGAVERQAPDGTVLDIRDYAAEVTGGQLSAGDDAADARWVSPGRIGELPLTRGLAEALTAWGVLHPQPPAALIAEGTRRAGLVWLSTPGQDRPRPAWHVWAAGAAYLVTGPGEQPLPGLANADRVGVTVPSKASGGTLTTWTATVHPVDPGSAEWDAVVGPLASARLNAALAPGEGSPAERWARSGMVLRLRPVPSSHSAQPHRELDPGVHREQAGGCDSTR